MFCQEKTRETVMGQKNRTKYSTDYKPTVLVKATKTWNQRHHLKQSWIMDQRRHVIKPLMMEIRLQFFMLGGLIDLTGSVKL